MSSIAKQVQRRATLLGNGSEPRAGTQELRAYLEGQKAIGRRGMTVEADDLGCGAGDVARRQGERK